MVPLVCSVNSSFWVLAISADQNLVTKLMPGFVVFLADWGWSMLSAYKAYLYGTVAIELRPCSLQSIQNVHIVQPDHINKYFRLQDFAFYV